MSVWVCVPSKRPAEHVCKWAAAWADQGYKVLIYRDYGQTIRAPSVLRCFLTSDPLFNTYPGYAIATNAMIDFVLSVHDECDWVVIGGDDIYPDQNHTADEIARECENHFRLAAGYPQEVERCATYGVMQPTGDRYGEDARSIQQYGPLFSAYADRVCGSPWLGREFCERINQGRGPLWPEYTHMFVDQELQDIAVKHGILWQRRDLIHRHEHWARKRADVADRPEWLAEVSGPQHWRTYKALYDRRKAAGFPGSEPL